MSVSKSLSFTSAPPLRNNRVIYVITTPPHPSSSSMTVIWKSSNPIAIQASVLQSYNDSSSLSVLPKTSAGWLTLDEWKCQMMPIHHPLSLFHLFFFFFLNGTRGGGTFSACQDMSNTASNCHRDLSMRFHESQSRLT